MKRICVITGTRAEYGLLRWVMDGILNSPLLELQILVTGAHLSPEFGMTVSSIERDGFKIDKRVEILLSSDSRTGISKSMGLGCISFGEALSDLNPDLVLLLGDRYEIFAAASSAMICCIPIAHLHGGELTLGAQDDAMRHCITKMSHLHFVATDEYRRRVIQMGETPTSVLNVGGLGVDALLHIDLLSREDLEEALEFRLLKRNLLITFHPVTLEPESNISQMEALLASLDDLGELGLIFTMPNADSEGRAIFEQIEYFCSSRSHARVYKSLGQNLYFSCMSHVNGVIGNSSSGLLEAPGLKIGSVNIGNRQSGRLRASSVIDCLATRDSISSALNELFSDRFQSKLNSTTNPYGQGGASKAIVDHLEQMDFDQLLKKRFHDIHFNVPLMHSV